MSKDVIIETFVCSTLTMILSWLIYRSSQQQARAVAARHYVLQYGLPLRSICAFGLVLFSVCLIFAKFKPDTSKEDLGWVFAIGALIAFMLGFTIEVFTARVEYDESNIYTFTPWRSNRTIPWQNIVSWCHNQDNNWLIIKTRTYGKVQISTYMFGIHDLIQQLKQQGEIHNFAEEKLKKFRLF